MNIHARNITRFSDFARTLCGDTIRTIVEVGSRDGQETRAFAARFPHASIYSFECNPHTLPLCRAAVADLANVTLIEKAISDRIGEISFYPIDTANTVTADHTGNPGASSLLRASGQYALEEYVQLETVVPSTTLAAFMAERQLPGIDLLWMDIQGAELMALQGLGERLADVGLIHLEVEFLEIYSGQPLYQDIATFLKAQGFAFAGFTIYAKHSADAVFVNRRRYSAGQLTKAVLQHQLLLKKRLTYLRHRAKRALIGRM